MPDQAQIRRYLLGETTEDEAEDLERAYFATEDTLDAVGAAEWDLIEDYLSGHLEPGTRSRFEAHYLRIPAHRTRLAIARGLHAQPARRRTRMVPFVWPLAAAAILLLAVLGAIWALRLPQDLRRPAASMVRLNLPLVAVRGEGEAPTAHLAPDTGEVELHLERGELAPPYEITLRTVEGTQMWHGHSADDPPTARIPAADLPAGDYVVVLEAGPERSQQRYYVRLLRP